MTAIRAGLLDRTIVIEAPNVDYTVDPTGGIQFGWNTLGTMRARLAGQEVVEEVKAEARGAMTIERLTFEMRWLDNVTTACRVTYAGKVYNVKGATEIQRRNGLVLRVERIGA